MAKKKAKLWEPRKSYAEMRARSQRLELRPLLPSDFEAWRAANLGRKPRQNRFDDPVRKATELTRARFRKHLKDQNVGARKLMSFPFAVFDRESGVMVGAAGYYVINRGMRWANLGYGIYNQYWGQGIASEAARLCVKIGFGPLNFHRIEASCEPVNGASAKVALRAGLRSEGPRRKFFPHKGGVDLMVFAENQIDYRMRAVRRDRMRVARRGRRKKRARR